METIFNTKFFCGMCVFVHMCKFTPRLLITGSMIWTTHEWLNKFYNFIMAAVVGTVSRCGLRIEECHKNRPNKTKLALYKLLISL